MPESHTDNTLDIIEGDHVRGTDTTSTTVLVYGDYECPHTRALELVLTRLRRREPNAFRSVFRHFPLRDIHPHSQQAAEAAEAVYALAGIERRGAEAGVDPAALRAAVEAGKFADRVERDVDSGAANGVDRTPSVFINGERYLGARDVPGLQQAVAATRK